MSSTNEIREKIKKEFPNTNIHALPKIEKVVINVGCGKVTDDPKYIEKVEKDLVKIIGQKPIKTHARQSISGFKIRENLPIGLKITLRGKRMRDFLNRLINITLPRVRDFRGIKNKSITNEGNVNIGIKEHSVFPEIEHDKIEKVFGLQANIVTTAENKNDAKKLLKVHGMVFEK